MSSHRFRKSNKHVWKNNLLGFTYSVFCCVQLLFCVFRFCVFAFENLTFIMFVTGVFQCVCVLTKFDIIAHVFLWICTCIIKKRMCVWMRVKNVVSGTISCCNIDLQYLFYTTNNSNNFWRRQPLKFIKKEKRKEKSQQYTKYNLHTHTHSRPVSSKTYEYSFMQTLVEYSFILCFVLVDI